MIAFRFTCFQGWEVIYNLLPESWQARIVARKLLRGPYKGTPPEILLIEMPASAYRIIDTAGRVRRTDERAPAVM